MVTLTLANLPLDLQITICILLHPFDILALRKTCKTLEIATRRRVVWVAVLYQVCLENTLFLPSFPIPDMSDLELEKAAMAPRRWIELWGAKKQHPNDFDARVHPQTTRFIKHVDPESRLFLVPGGRFLVHSTSKDLFVWDLGCDTSADSDCKLISSVGLKDFSWTCFKVQATSDGMGLIILFPTDTYISIFEIYPQSETPLPTQIAQLDRRLGEYPVHLLPDTVIFRAISEEVNVFRVFDYRVNYSTRFSTGLDPQSRRYGWRVETFATKTAIIVFYEDGILIWAIPPLLPNFLDETPTYVPPLFRFPFPDGIERFSSANWNVISSWYFGSCDIYFDTPCANSKYHRFKVVVKPDLSDASLYYIDTFEFPHRDNALLWQPRFSQAYRTCEDSPVPCWLGSGLKCGRLTSTTLSPGLISNFPLVGSLCPASGRFAFIPNSYYCSDITVVDF